MVSAKGAILKSIVQRAHVLTQDGLRLRAFVNNHAEAYKERYTYYRLIYCLTRWANQRLAYYSVCLEMKNHSFTPTSSIVEFPSFRTWNGATFSKHYMTTLLDRFYNDDAVLRGGDGEELTRSLFHHRSLQQGLAVVTAEDATFKFVKSMKDDSNAESLYSILNERNEVFLSFLSLLTLKVILTAPLLNDNLRDLKGLYFTCW
jgi:hypothetical protein